MMISATLAKMVAQTVNVPAITVACDTAILPALSIKSKPKPPSVYMVVVAKSPSPWQAGG
jgi:hypothetical protein